MCDHSAFVTAKLSWLIVAGILAMGSCTETDWPICADVPARANISASICGVENILQIHAGVRYEDQTPRLCKKDCISAVQSVVLSATDCSAAELDAYLGVNNSRRRLAQVINGQSKCFPPSLSCFRTFRDMESFEDSSSSQLCTSVLEEASSEVRPLVAQAQSNAFCHGPCGVNVSTFLNKLEDLGCVQWNAYRQMKLKYDLACHTVDGTFCASVFNEDKFRGEIRDVLAADPPVNTSDVDKQEAFLNVMCTPCFQEHIRLSNRYSIIGNDRLHILEKICVKDDFRFCYPRYRLRQRHRNSQTLIDYASEICDLDYMGQCAGKMQIREMLDLIKKNRSQREIDNLRINVDTMCVKYPSDETGGSDRLCVDAMSKIVGGYYDNRSFIGDEYSGPSTCSTISLNSTCSWACQRDYEFDRDSFGCCYNTFKQYLADLEFSNSIFSRSDLIGSECNRESMDECVVFDEKTKAVATIIFEVPFWFLQNNETVKTLVLNDVMRTTGYTSSAVSIKGYRYRSRTTTFVDFEIIGQNVAAVEAAVARVEKDTNSGLVVNLDTDYMYNLQCHESRGAVCSSSGVVSPSIVVLVSAVITASLFLIECI